MDRPRLPFTGLRAFEVSARQGSFTQAAVELCVSQAAVSHQVISLEEALGVTLFNRTPKGLILTDEGQALLPVLTKSFDSIGSVLDRFMGGRYMETINVGVVTTFAVGWLIENLPRFLRLHPGIDVRVSTNNNKVDLSKEGLDMAIRFGDGAWAGLEAVPLIETPLTPMCAPEIAKRLQHPAALHKEVLLRSYRNSEWPAWFEMVGESCPDLRGPLFDSSIAMADMAEAGAGVALLPARMLPRRVSLGRLVQPYQDEIRTGCYWLTFPKAKTISPAMSMFENWIRTEIRTL
ncbi:LysR family transcriptional regulator [Motiliproteus sp. MSK22-1]|uniref:LysR family transcriptional regulator n=1 Tax=Motiliproteus sp. MSK22-1 TaxID=1897630 RepID=UPI000976761C|nr:LysR family transcriptional regulator [Motiliproteus sp. MSK22-1]OMH39287.1 LysR family transcriptional regulator [Motiliproteus sp. MSK22-1]